MIAFTFWAFLHACIFERLSFLHVLCFHGRLHHAAVFLRRAYSALSVHRLGFLILGPSSRLGIRVHTRLFIKLLEVEFEFVLLF